MMIDAVLTVTKQLYEWFSPSVTPFSLCSHHCIIMKWSGVVTNDRSDVHAKARGQRSQAKVTEVQTPFSHFQIITAVWIHIWWWNDAQILMLLRKGALLYFKVIHQISRSRKQNLSVLAQIWRFRTVYPVWIHRWLWNNALSLNQYIRSALLFFKDISQISRSHCTKNYWFWPELRVSRP